MKRLKNFIVLLVITLRELGKKITQLDLALTIGHKSMSTIGKIEAGLEDKHYNVEQLYKIAKVLDINICVLFTSLKS